MDNKTRVLPLVYASNNLTNRGRLLLIDETPYLTSTNMTYSLTAQDVVGISASQKGTCDIEHLFKEQNVVSEFVGTQYTVLGQHRGGQLRLTLFFPEVEFVSAAQYASAYAKKLDALLDEDAGRYSYVVTICTTHLIAEPAVLHEFMSQYMKG